MEAAFVSVVVPTLRRPAPLKRALTSLLAQKLAAGDAFEIVVVDNSSDGDAEALVRDVAAGASTPVRYVSETVPGVSTARNRGVREANGAWIAFLDDDEEAGPEWLRGHLATLRATDADAAFGPVAVAAEAGEQLGPFERYFDRSIDRADAADITDLAAYLGTNNSMFRRERCLSQAEPFALELNSVGGEDSLLLKQLVRSGRRFAWSARSEVVEWVPPKRLTWSYVHRRKFLSGQIRCFVLDMLEPRPTAEIARWMLVGAAQTIGFGALALAARPFSAVRARHFAATAWGGLGKILWMRRFRPSLYGKGLVS